MKGTELRIGNYVNFNGIPKQVYSLGDPSGEELNLTIEISKDVTPIELSVEKAVKWLGFKEQNGMYFLPIDVGLTLCYLPDKNILQLAIGNRALNYSNPKVHQVQNLFYTFTGKELEVTLPS